jgi:hypothetical protein
MEKPSRSTQQIESEEQAFWVRLLGFISEEQIGLGEVIKRATSYVGLKPCGACERRAAALNQRVVFFRSLTVPDQWATAVATLGHSRG